MTEKELLKSGYFPKELPPAFNTFTLAAKLSFIIDSWNTYMDDPTVEIVKTLLKAVMSLAKEKRNIKKILIKNFHQRNVLTTLLLKANYPEDI